MFVLPVGVEAKTTGIPWATLTIVAVTAFYSVLHWSPGKRLTEYYAHSSEQRHYQRELKSFVAKQCGDAKTNAILDRHVLQEHFIRYEIFEKLHGTRLSKEFLACAKPYFDQKNVKEWGEPTLIAIADIYKQRLKMILVEDSLLSADSMSLKTVLRAQFLHGGWMHLIGNLVFLLLLAFPVEQRLGGPLFLLTYVAAGTIGLTVSTLLEPNAIYTIGASGNIFGIAGAFMALFYRNQMRVLVSFFFVSHRVVLIPVAVYFGVWVVAEESLSILKQTPDGIAHWAHLGGFAVGAAFAGIFKFLWPLPAGHTYPYELGFKKKLEAAGDLKKKLKILSYWIQLNPSNREIALEALKVCEQDLTGQGSYALRFLELNGLTIFQRYLKDAEMIEAFPLEGLFLPARSVAPRALRKALDSYLRTGQSQAEWKILFALAQANEEGPAEWKSRLRELTRDLADHEMSHQFRIWAQRNTAVKDLINEASIKGASNVG